MQSNTALNFLPAIEDDKKLEVSIEDGEAVIRLSTWTEGLGWCGQKTMKLDAQMLDHLHKAVASARYKLNQAKAEPGNEGMANIIEFPSVA